MSIQKSINLALAGFLAMFGVAFMLLTLNASAQEADTEVTPVTTSESEELTESTEESSTETYEYVAQSGDSYSLMARKAIQTYGINNSVNLTGAQIIYAETSMTKEADSPVLNLGQSVSINESTVQKWVENAQGLTEEQQALWQPYANRANFNTDAVGESQE